MKVYTLNAINNRKTEFKTNLSPKNQNVSFSGNPFAQITTNDFSRTGLFLKAIPGLSCPYCGEKMLSRFEIDASRDVISTSVGKNLYSALTDILGSKCIFPERKIIDVVSKTALQHPEKSISDIFKTLHALCKRRQSMNYRVKDFVERHYDCKPRTIAYKLMEPFTVSFEHISPSLNGKGGISDFSNYLLTHKKCNSNRLSVPFVEYIKNNPNTIKFIEKHFDILGEKAKTEPNIRIYLNEVVNTLLNESSGLINIKKTQ